MKIATHCATPCPISASTRSTSLVGENGSGKFTLIEAIAILMGFNAEGGSRNFRFATTQAQADLHRHLRPTAHARD